MNGYRYTIDDACACTWLSRRHDLAQRMLSIPATSRELASQAPLPWECNLLLLAGILISHLTYLAACGSTTAISAAFRERVPTAAHQKAGAGEAGIGERKLKVEILMEATPKERSHQHGLGKSCVLVCVCALVPLLRLRSCGRGVVRGVCTFSLLTDGHGPMSALGRVGRHLPVSEQRAWVAKSVCAPVHMSVSIYVTGSKHGRNIG